MEGSRTPPQQAAAAMVGQEQTEPIFVNFMVLPMLGLNEAGAQIPSPGFSASCGSGGTDGHPSPTSISQWTAAASQGSLLRAVQCSVHPSVELHLSHPISSPDATICPTLAGGCTPTVGLSRLPPCPGSLSFPSKPPRVSGALEAPPSTCSLLLGTRQHIPPRAGKICPPPLTPSGPLEFTGAPCTLALCREESRKVGGGGLVSPRGQPVLCKAETQPGPADYRICRLRPTC